MCFYDCYCPPPSFLVGSWPPGNDTKRRGGFIGPTRVKSGQGKSRTRVPDTYDHVQVTRQETILEDTPIGNIDALALVRHHNHSPTQGHVSTEVDVPSYRQMVQLEDLGDLLEPLLELLDLNSLNG